MRYFVLLICLLAISACAERNAATGEWQAKPWKVSVEPPEKRDPKDYYRPGSDDTYCTQTQRDGGEC